MLEINGKWFYKKPGVKMIDLCSAFFDGTFTGGEVTVTLYAPPASGENDEAHGIPGNPDSWQTDYVTVLPALPRFRVCYAPVLDARKK